MLKQKIIKKLCDTIPSFKTKFFVYGTKREYEILVKNKNLSLKDSERKQIKEYWNKYYKNIDLNYHTLYYNLNGIKDPRYIPDNLYYKYIDYYFNNMEYNSAFEDKNYYDVWFKDFNRPKTVIHNIGGVFYDNKYNIIEMEKAVKLINNSFKTNKELIMKPTVETNSGRNVLVINKGSDLTTLFDKYKKNFIVQELIHQHKDIAKIHKESINTIRVVSLLWKNEVIILGSVLRMGVNNSRVDNSNSGGLHVGIKGDGHLREFAYNHKTEKFAVHPQGFIFKKGKIPNYDKLCETVKKAHSKFGYFKLIHWDFSIDENGEPILIEFNIGQGGVFLLQYTNGPIFGDLTDEILEEIFIKNKNSIK